MIRSYLSHTFLFLVVMFSSVVANAAAPAWKILANESSLTFTGTQNDAPTSGSFKKFTGEIYFDPAQLNDSRVKIIIDTSSISTSYKDLEDTLKTPDWFNVKVFPQAIFEAKKITKMGENKYQSNGTLTIRDKTVPVTLTFAAEEISKDKVQVKGSTMLKRTAFGIGQGEWASTDEVKDEVQVNFVITAIKN